MNRSCRLYHGGVKTSRLEIIGSAAAGIAHDINNQLTMIVNHLSTADVESANAAVARCSALTSSLLSYCRGEPLQLSAVDPAGLLRQFAQQVRLPLGIALELNVPTGLPAIEANSFAVKRALTNLVSNACAAMEDRGTLRITAKPGEIEVSDTGPGVPAEHRKEIFAPFFTTKGNKGTGLGLSIVRELMRQQGGSVCLHSEPGHGAQFTLRFRVRAS